VPPALCCKCSVYPALKRWAKLFCPCGAADKKWYSCEQPEHGKIDRGGAFDLRLGRGMGIVQAEDSSENIEAFNSRKSPRSENLRAEIHFSGRSSWFSGVNSRFCGVNSTTKPSPQPYLSRESCWIARARSVSGE